VLPGVAEIVTHDDMDGASRWAKVHRGRAPGEEQATVVADQVEVVVRCMDLEASRQAGPAPPSVGSTALSRKPAPF
jgi:hypothetical protein